MDTHVRVSYSVLNKNQNNKIYKRPFVCRVIYTCLWSRIYEYKINGKKLWFCLWLCGNQGSGRGWEYVWWWRYMLPHFDSICASRELLTSTLCSLLVETQFHLFEHLRCVPNDKLHGANGLFQQIDGLLVVLTINGLYNREDIDGNNLFWILNVFIFENKKQ